MLEFVTSMDWVSLVDTLFTVGLLVVAATPTDKDNNALGRVSNLWRIVTPFLRRTR